MPNEPDPRPRPSLSEAADRLPVEPGEREPRRRPTIPDPGEREPRRRPTIADVARRAGVSPAAVSFAVNDRPGVSPETRERILDAARELGWRPSASARALTEARSRAIGLVLARDPAQLELDSFFVRFLSGLELRLAPADYALLLQVVPVGPALGAYERLAAAGRVDGFLLTDVEVDDARFPLLEDAGLPVVLAGHPASECPFPWVETRHAEGMEAAVVHLRELGHERIAFLGGPSHYEHIQVRLARWRAAAGPDAGPVVHTGPEDAARSARAVLGGDDAAGTSSRAAPRPTAAGRRPTAAARRPTAVVCASDALAMAVVAAARELGLGVPGDVSVVGFDDSPLAALSSPALTSVRVDYAEFGTAAAGALLAAIAGEPPPDYAPSAPVLVPRASTGRAP
jgi:LacI family repressor for deo operon, udp, cdd, tsx, nupC, and nupG